MGIRLFEVDKDKIQFALEDMNKTYETPYKFNVVAVTEKDDCYHVLVDYEHENGWITSMWRNNRFMSKPL